MNEDIINALEQNKKIVFEYCDKEIVVNRGTTLNELQEKFGFGLDMLDIARANWRILE